MKDLRFRLGVFVRDFGTRPIAAIRVEELDGWLRDLPYEPKGRANFRANISVLFGHATKRRMIDTNPIAHTERPRLTNNPPEIFTVDELTALLNAASTIAADVLPMLAICAFAGLRDAEIRRLDWNEVDLVRGHIEVTAAKSKTAQRRLVPIQPNLLAWLRPYSSLTGRVVPKGARGKVESARKEANLMRWPNNGLRHSFASYRLAATQNAPLVSLELGHISPQLLFNTYRELVHKEEAGKYWEIKPATEAGNVVAFGQ